MSHLTPHEQVQELIKAAHQMGGLNAAVRALQSRALAPRGTDAVRQQLDQHKPCAGCADKAKAVEARLNGMQRDLNDVRALLTRALAEVEVLRAQSGPTYAPNGVIGPLPGGYPGSIQY